MKKAGRYLLFFLWMGLSSGLAQESTSQQKELEAQRQQLKK